jgi:DNA-binding XRE family transcriptional regulator
MAKSLDTTHHDRRLARRLEEDPEFRMEFERQRREIAQIDAVVTQLDELRKEVGMSKAELARAIGKEPSSIRRFFTADVNPELKTVAAVADVLGARVEVVTTKTNLRSGLPSGPHVPPPLRIAGPQAV